ncbi:tRNA pseudouridine(55) synthase TruB [Desertibacillus haloalkaliphilus]|uniref:tRNA pseudouridine(55) synthase TruB n=1 Tax=Desertibacillus haloalkaliphilus TaxID=1328930 RepID=UPI001FE437EF|nr:tRNA pseudouridine(55) synthase TruB [Desertibacillus haloalkaliphilus]
MNRSGILPLYKPKGVTSHDCVAKVRKILKTKKVGHTGTLDPDVTGVLPICIGRATKIAEYMTDYPKTYEGEVTLGFSTTTEDASGECVEQKRVDRVITKNEVEKVIKRFVGEIKQIPPMYSAVKVKGKRLYEYAREGKHVDRPVRMITIHELTLLGDIKQTEQTVSFRFRVHCSKGTYVRTLAVDIGKELGYPAHMSDLIRTESGPFMLKQCLTLEQLTEQAQAEDVELLSIEQAVSHFTRVTVDPTIETKVRNGMVLPQFKGIEEKRVSVYNESGECLAIYQQHPTKKGFIKPEKIIKID